MDVNYDELNAAFKDIKQAQSRIEADRAALRKKMLDAEPTWGPCLQCGNTWRCKHLRRRAGKPPRACPRCKSPYWWDPDYLPRVPKKRQYTKRTETRERTEEAKPVAPMPPVIPTSDIAPPPKAPRLAPDESVRFAEDDALEMMRKARENGS